MVNGGDEKADKMKKKISKKTKSKKGKLGKKGGKKGKGKKIKQKLILEATEPPVSDIEDGDPNSKKVGYQEMAEFGKDTCVSAKPPGHDETCTANWKDSTFCPTDSIDVIKAPCSRFGNQFCMESCENTRAPCADEKVSRCLDPKCKNVCLQLAREEICKDMVDRETQARICLERLSYERDYYRAEFERLLKFFEKLGQPNEEEDNEFYCIACRKKNEIIEYLQHENQVLTKEKFCMVQQMQASGNQDGSNDSPMQLPKCSKASCKRMERERDMLKLDIQRLEEEIDALQEKIKVVGETKTRDFAKYQEERCEYESTILKLEGERRELIKGQGIRRATINALEEKVNMYNTLLRAAQEEVHRFKLQYCQLKKLHEQCDTALLDTQAQLLDVEAQLQSCQKQKDPNKNRKNDRNVSILAVPPKCPCFDAATAPDRTSFASDDVKRKLQQLDQDRDELLNALDSKTEDLQICEDKIRERDEIIGSLDEEIANLRNELSNMEEEINLLQQKCKKSELELQEKDMKIENLHSQTDDKLVDMKSIQTLLEEKNQHNKQLQAEVECLNKETCMLACSNLQLTRATEDSKVQISVAIETVHEVEDKNRQLERIIDELECRLQTMKLDMEDCKVQMKRKELEIAQLRNNTQSKENICQKLDVENKSREKKICALKCQCQKLEQDFNNHITEIKQSKEALENTNSDLRKRITKLEEKLFNCICCICDNVRDKSLIAKCVFRENDEEEHVEDCASSENKDGSVSGGASGCAHKKAKSSTNSIKQVLAAKPLREKSSNVITSQSTLPGCECECDPDNQSFVASLYHSVDPAAPFSYKMENVESQHAKRSPLNVITEEISTDSIFTEEKAVEPSSSWICSPLYGSVEEKKGKYIIDNITSVCKIVQVDTQERIIRKTTMKESPKSRFSRYSDS